MQVAVERVEFARRYTQQFLGGLTPDEWFWQPSELTTHIAWQVAHLSVAQYNLCLRRVRGRIDADQAFMPEAFFDRFKVGSQPAIGAAANPPLEEIRRVFDSVHRQSLCELAERTDEELDVPTDPPHPAFQTKLGGVEYCPSHEFVHAGQIALLRRLMGKAPLR
jgi:hypothetical protein